MFLHGYLSSGMAFNRQIAFFNRDFQVFAPDLKGFGTNTPMEYPYSLDDYVDEVKEYMYKYSIKRPFVVAHSFGARIVLKAVAKENYLFDKLVLTGAAGLKPKPTLKKCCKKIQFKILSKFLSKEKLARFYSKDYNALSPVMKKSFIKIVNEHLDYTLKDINNKTLLIFGEKDKETPLYMARKLNDGLKNSKLIIYKDAGHFCFLDKPMMFNWEVKEFFLNNEFSI
ncbi:MAG: alpha/beta hydrolase [Clostridia bacterium]|nr:alpha/beta hydrolase [Clostridia bacterium]